MRTTPGRGARSAALWGIGGVVLIFLDAIVQLGRRGIEVVRAGLSPSEWLAGALLIALFLYGEGVRALQRRWVPHVVTRIRALTGEQRTSHRVLAPLYVMSLVGAPARTLLRAWAGVAGIVLAVLIVRALPDPWRGLIDLAVAIALAWGLGALLRQSRHVLQRAHWSDGGEASRRDE